MKNLILFLLVILIIPVKQVLAQQRSTYDLAAWIIASVDSYDTTTVNWALKEGGQIDFKRGGMNALEMAMYYKKTAMIKFLLNKGASVDSINQDGMNALQYAEKIGNPEITQLIKSRWTNGVISSISDTGKAAAVRALPRSNASPTQEANIPFNALYKVGDKVLHSRDRGKTWEPGLIKEVSSNARILADGIPPYLVENVSKTSQNYLDANFVTTFERQPWWTSFFVGDWKLNAPIAATERIIDREVYTIIGGGDRLPPIRINANGTYSWVISKTKIIKGKWTKNADAPGIILLNGYRDVNWVVYNTSDSNNRKIFKTDYIIIADQNGNYLSNHGFRIVKK